MLLKTKERKEAKCSTDAKRFVILKKNPKPYIKSETKEQSKIKSKNLKRSKVITKHEGIYKIKEETAQNRNTNRS